MGLYLAFSKIDLGNLNINLNLMHLLYFLLGSFITFIAFMFTSIRLKLLVNDISFKDVNRVTFIGIFFNMILPSSIGGDLVRIYEIDKYIRDYRKSSVVIVIDRVIGLSGLAAISVTGLLLILIEGKSVDGLIIKLVLGSVITLISFWSLLYLFVHYSTHLYKFKIKNKPFNNIFKKFISISEIIKTLSSKSIFLSFLLSMLTHLLSSFAFIIVVTYMYYEEVSMFISITINSLINLLLILPISIGGIGVRDYLFTIFMPSIKESEYFVLIGTTIFLLATFSAIYGAVLFMLNKKKYEQLLKQE